MRFVNDVPDFEFASGSDGRCAELALHGRLENLAAVDLWAALERLIDLRQPLVLDLTALDFIGPAGLLTLSNAERSFAEAGVEFSLRTPARLIQQLVGAMGQSEVEHLDEALASVGGLGGEHVHAVDHPSGSSTSAAANEESGRVTAIPRHADAVDGVLRLVAELVRVSVGGADGVSVSLFRDGRLLPIAATNDIFLQMDTEQCVAGEGPSVDASLQGSERRAVSSVADARWPSFTARTRSLGILAVLALPLLVLEKPVGALTVYARAASIFDVDAQWTAREFATQASMILRDADVGVANSRLALRFQEVLRSRESVAAAKGSVSASDRSNEDDVFTNLLRHSIKRKAAHRHAFGPLEQRAGS